MDERIFQKANLRPERELALDLVKGFLVQVMALYHSILYFMDGRPVILRYLDFSTGSFVFISGFIISQFYIYKYKSDEYTMMKRLMSRGLKIIMIFMIVNTFMHMSFDVNHTGAQLGIHRFYGNLYSVLVLGDKRLAAFEILLPIAYLLLACSQLTLLLRRPALIVVIILLLFIYCDASEEVPFNAYFLSIGFGGLAFGYLRREKYRALCNTKYRFLIFLPVVLYGSVSYLGEKTIIVYLFSIILMFLAAYLTGSMLNYDRFVNRMLVVLGEYSLVCYLWQILLLQVLFRLLGDLFSAELSIVFAFLALNMLMYPLCKCITVLRRKNGRLDMIYRSIFS